MANNAQFIYGGGGDLTLYDATNGWFNAGYLSDLELSDEPVRADSIRGQKVQFYSRHILTSEELQSHNALVAELNNRRNVEQTVYITSDDGALFTMSGVLINYGLKRPFNASDAHKTVITLQTGVEPTQEENLIGADGKFETDSNSDGLADNWTNSPAVSSVSIVTSHLSGEGNAQQISISAGNSGAVYYSKTAPFESPKKITFSAYIKANAASTFIMRISTYNYSGTLINSYDKTVTMSLSETTRQSHSVQIAESSGVRDVRCAIVGDGTNAADITMDNAQLEFGNLKDFRAA
ncbi:MAG TPA: hypothetical protein ENK32_07840 [Anaerolineae bacterium]|nr:hypothetical protein [Anaerolineae bacterium]